MDSKTTIRSSFQPQESKDSSDQKRGSFQREPPVVPERVAVLKANYKQAWLFFLLGLCLVFAWGGVIRYALIRAFAFNDDESIPRTSTSFVAIAYEGISESEKEVTPELFTNQIEVLVEAGYHAVTLEEVRAFYEEGELLPEKAVLLTFDHSRKSSYFDARKVLQDEGWRAVMFIWTKPILDEDPSALRWPYVRAMINSGAWEAGAQSYRGFERIPSDSEGRLSNFLTSPMWLEGQNRFESPQEFRERLMVDHQRVHDLITRETNREPVAFAFPYGDFGQYDERAILTRRLNMDLVDEFYDLAFILGNAALNTEYTNPLRLNRLLVDPQWDGKELLARLEASWPQELGTDTDLLLSQSKRWQHDWGDFDLLGDKLVLSATDSNTGAKAWINGTDMYLDFSARLKMNIDRGQAGVFLRASKDGESHLYLGLGDEGEVWLRQKSPGMDSFTLGTSRYQREPDGSVVLDIYIRGNQFFASTGGEPLFEEIILTRGETRPGMIGLSVWDPEVGAANLEITQVEVEPFHNRLVTWEPLVARQPYLAGWMSRNGYRYTLLSAPWLHLGAQGRAEQLGWNPEYYLDMATVYNMKFAPEIIVEQIDNIDKSMAENLAARAENLEAEAVFCNLSTMKGGLNINRITTWLGNLSEALEAKGIGLIVSLPPSLNRGNTISSLLQGLDNLQIAGKADQIDEQQGIERSDPRLVTWNHVNLDRSDYPLFFQLSGGDAEEQLWTNEVRSRLLWEQGFESFQDGDFDLAIDLWTRWEEVEPYNEKPPRFIGDVHRRKQDYKLAVDYYKKSLELNPGQISLVVTTVGILNQFIGDSEAAADMLNLYRRLFPNNSEIALAQAELLLGDDQVVAAGDRIKEVIERSPEDLTALALLHNLLQSSEERVENLEKIVEVGNKLGMYTHFANSISGYNLLLWPESWRLMNLVSERAQMDHPDADLYKKLLPRDTVLREQFNLGRLSDEWESTSSVQNSENEGDPLYLSAVRTGTEAVLKLKRSETMQNGFIECELDEAVGYFWLYARRSEGNMIRFGFEPNGRLFLQIWKENKIVKNVSREWVHPHNPFQMRMEIRGDAVFAFLNGSPAFGAPVRIPSGMNLGWWGIGPWAPQFGVAQAELTEVAGGPLPTKIGLFDIKTRAWSDDALSETIKNSTHAFSVISPPWFVQDVGGNVRSAYDLEFKRTRLLSRYYKIRLYPLIVSASARTLDIEELVRLARSSKADGFTLSFSRMPSEEWFRETESALVGTGIGILALEMHPIDQTSIIREMGSAPSLFSGPRIEQKISVVDVSMIENPKILLEESEPSVRNELMAPVSEQVEEDLAQSDPGQTAVAPTNSTAVSKPVHHTIYLF